MITAQVELFADTYDEARPMLEAHYRELALHHELIPYDPDVQQYLNLEACGMLHIVTVRRDGVLVGYWSGFVKGHIHYKSTLMAFTDIYYVNPALRGVTRAAWVLFEEVKRSLRQRGCKRIIIPTKTHVDNSRFLEHIGGQEIERIHEILL